MSSVSRDIFIRAFSFDRDIVDAIASFVSLLWSVSVDHLDGVIECFRITKVYDMCLDAKKRVVSLSDIFAQF